MSTITDSKLPLEIIQHIYQFCWFGCEGFSTVFAKELRKFSCPTITFSKAGNVSFAVIEEELFGEGDFRRDQEEYDTFCVWLTLPTIPGQHIKLDLRMEGWEQGFEECNRQWEEKYRDQIEWSLIRNNEGHYQDRGIFPLAPKYLNWKKVYPEFWPSSDFTNYYSYSWDMNRGDECDASETTE